MGPPVGYERMYGVFWNDQPPFHTALLKLLFQCLGTEAAHGRMLSLLFASVLVWLVFDLGWIWAGPMGAICGTISLICSPDFLLLSVATMIGLPAYALGMLSLRVLMQASGGPRWMLLSGGIFGLALQTKLTAIVLLPPVLLHFVFRQSAKQYQVWKHCVAWTAGMFLGLTLVWLFYPMESWRDLVTNHFDREVKDAFANSKDYLTLNGMLVSQPRASLLVLAGLGCLLLKWRRHFVFSLAMLTAAYVAHVIHKPFWHYYYLHVAVPMALITGIGVGILWNAVRQFNPDSSRREQTVGAIAVLVFSSLACLTVKEIPQRIRYEHRFAGIPERPLEWKIVSLLKSHAAQTKWVYTDRATFAFYANVMIPPELAVVPLKRILAGRITDQEVVNYLYHYKPEQIVLQRPFLYNHNTDEFLKRFYVQVLQDGSLRYYVLRRLVE